MTTTIKSSADGTQAIIQVNGVDKVVVGSNGIESGSYKAGSIRPVDTQVGALPSMVRVNTQNGYGSTNTVIRRFLNTTVNQGSDITYADSATLGASFTINANGVYAVTYADGFGSGVNLGISLNTTVPTTTFILIPIAEQISAVTSAGSNQPTSCSVTQYFPAGSIIRPHASGAGPSAYTNTTFSVTRVA